MDHSLMTAAERVALYEELVEEIKPNFNKVLNILNMKTKNLLKDMIEATKDEDEQLLIRILHMMMEDFEEIYRYMGMREFKTKLHNITEKQFEDKSL